MTDLDTRDRARPRRAAPSAITRRPSRAGQAAGARARRAARSTRARSPRRRCSPTGRRTASAPTAWSPASGTIDGAPGRADGQRPDRQGRLLGAQDGREDHPHPGAGARPARSRWSTSSTRPARGSPTRSQMFPGRRGAGRIFFNEVRLSGVVPQVCVLFGPSAAGGAYIPAFCDVVIMREGNASMYLGSPRMAEMVIGEKVTLEEMGGARMHTGVSGCGHMLVKTDEEGIDAARALPLLLPRRTGSGCRRSPSRPSPARRRRSASSSPPTRTSRSTCASCSTRWWTPTRSSRSTTRWAKELIVGYARLDGRGDRDRRQPAEVQGRRALRRLRRQGRALHLDLQRLRRPAAVPRRRARLHDRHAGRARRGSSATARR